MSSIKIKDINIVATWNYTTNLNCVCERSLHLPIINQEKKTICNNNIHFGECGHALHSECFDKYVKENNNICPFDLMHWKSLPNEYKIKYNKVNTV